MTPFDLETIRTFPVLAGVYLMKNRQGTVLYVGKANNLRMRIRQYFVKGGDGREMIPHLISQIANIDTIIVSSEKEALLLENHLIKKHRPKYNALLKDDKNYIALKLTKHEWPRVDIVRYKGKAKPDGFYFGPFTSAESARKTLDLLQKLFPLRQCSDAEFLRRTRPCILYDMKRCIAPCVQKCTKEQYALLVNRSKKFLSGQDQEVVKELYKEMEEYAEALEFERAADLLKTIRHIEKTMEKQIVSKPFGFDLDVFGIFREGDEGIVVLLFIRSGNLTGSRHYLFSKVLESDQELLRSFVLQYYEEEELLPHEILVPEEIEEAKSIEELLGENKKRQVALHCPKKGEKLALIKMAKINAEALFRKEKDANVIRERMLLSLQTECRLMRYPERIECFDISHFSGSGTVASMVAFTKGLKDSKRYRKYRIRESADSDDYGAMYEVLTRRLKKGKEESDLPDLVIVDGGRGQLNVAKKVLKELNIISVDLIAFVKEEGRHDRGMTAERVLLYEEKEPLLFKRHSPVLFLLQQVRDEAHRTSISHQKTLRKKTLLTSELDQIPGIGPVKRKRLLIFFGSVKAIREADCEQLQQVKGISGKEAQNIKDFFCLKENP